MTESGKASKPAGSALIKPYQPRQSLTYPPYQPHTRGKVMITPSKTFRNNLIEQNPTAEPIRGTILVLVYASTPPPSDKPVKTGNHRFCDDLHQNDPNSEKLCSTFFWVEDNIEDGISILTTFLGLSHVFLSNCRSQFLIFDFFKIIFGILEKSSKSR